MCSACAAHRHADSLTLKVVTMDLTVNRKNYSFDGSPDTPLLWALRDHLDITSVKFGCGEGLCGACSAHVDGELKRTCQVSCSEATGKDITTVEGLPPKVAEALKTAWLELDVAQCGYCQTGMIMAAADLLKNNGNPTDEEINDAMNKNVCRCGTYGRIRKAIHLAATRL